MTNEPFHTHLDRATAATWDAITTLPFLAELSTGRLEEARFAFFISQDIHYLDAFAGILQRAAELADNAEARAFLEGQAANVVVVEQALHGTFAPRLGLDVAAVRAQEPAPVTVAYIDHLRSIAAHGPLGEVIAAVLPCYWVYRRVGERLAGTRRRLETRPFCCCKILWIVDGRIERLPKYLHAIRRHAWRRGERKAKRQ